MNMYLYFLYIPINGERETDRTTVAQEEDILESSMAPLPFSLLQAYSEESRTQCA